MKVSFLGKLFWADKMIEWATASAQYYRTRLRYWQDGSSAALLTSSAHLKERHTQPQIGDTETGLLISSVGTALAAIWAVSTAAVCQRLISFWNHDLVCKIHAAFAFNSDTYAADRAEYACERSENVGKTKGIEEKRLLTSKRTTPLYVASSNDTLFASHMTIGLFFVLLSRALAVAFAVLAQCQLFRNTNATNEIK